MPTSPCQRYCRDDFSAYGRRFGIAYRFARQGRLPVVQGRVEEFALRPGMRLTHSDVEVLQHYASSSLQSAALLVLVVLEGCVTLQVGGCERHLRAGMAMSTRLVGSAHALHASQAPGQRLRTLTLGLEHAAALPQLALSAVASAPSIWRLPEHLVGSLEHALDDYWQAGAQRLLLEGLALQLLAHVQPAMPPHPFEQPGVSPGEQARLEAVRQRLLQQPMEAHRLEDLARLAAMSPSSLRSKFRHAFGQSVFDCLRQRRLTLAREYLAQGLSVQQTAQRCGYRHASNFTTAFRRHFGVSPRRLANTLA